MFFELFPWRFTFTAMDPIRFPPTLAGNVLRGAFGTIFRRVAPGAHAAIFAPHAAGGGPSGLADRPRPFVFRAAHLDGAQIVPGQSFYFDVHVFLTTRPHLESFVAVFSELATEGLGPGRGRARLESVSQCNIFGGAVDPARPLRLPLRSGGEPIRRLVVRFLTATELKSADGIVSSPEFPVLFSRARDRIATLSALYGAGPLDLDFHTLGRRAAGIRTTRCNLDRVQVDRRSSRTGQTHPLGGFTGEATYEGDLRDLAPFLRAAQWTGVGRQTVWGKGTIAVLDY